eukprot:TRINITY_DN2204_c0_g1_i15.p1 TRINITY_DN2204_c0_g1~~TRINITY_DN2204_c0_g1_i15.p1  ORF type:complete len:160 (-),score=29.54 TRINITY_DN2204_c0_g1_i15:1517-1996(-)
MKIAVLYVRGNQETPEEWASNGRGEDRVDDKFWKLMDVFGKKIALDTWKGFRGEMGMEGSSGINAEYFFFFFFFLLKSGFIFETVLKGKKCQKYYINKQKKVKLRFSTTTTTAPLPFGHVFLQNRLQGKFTWSHEKFVKGRAISCYTYSIIQLCENTFL